jgi:hypothetical protein
VVQPPVRTRAGRIARARTLPGALRGPGGAARQGQGADGGGEEGEGRALRVVTGRRGDGGAPRPIRSPTPASPSVQAPSAIRLARGPIRWASAGKIRSAMSRGSPGSAPGRGGGRQVGRRSLSSTSRPSNAQREGSACPTSRRTGGSRAGAATRLPAAPAARTPGPASRPPRPCSGPAAPPARPAPARPASPGPARPAPSPAPPGPGPSVARSTMRQRSAPVEPRRPDPGRRLPRARRAGRGPGPRGRACAALPPVQPRPATPRTQMAASPSANRRASPTRRRSLPPRPRRDSRRTRPPTTATMRRRVEQRMRRHRRRAPGQPGMPRRPRLPALRPAAVPLRVDRDRSGDVDPRLLLLLAGAPARRRQAGAGSSPGRSGPRRGRPGDAPGPVAR